MKFGKCQDEIKLYLDTCYVSQCEAFWRLETVTWNEVGVNPLEEIVERPGGHDTTLTAYFKANTKYEAARNVYYQDFPSAFVCDAKKCEWKPRQRGFAIGHIYFVTVKAGECFYLRLLLTAVKGATFFEDLQTYNGVTYPTF